MFEFGMGLLIVAIVLLLTSFASIKEYDEFYVTTILFIYSLLIGSFGLSLINLHFAKEEQKYLVKEILNLNNIAYSENYDVTVKDKTLFITDSADSIVVKIGYKNSVDGI